MSRHRTCKSQRFACRFFCVTQVWNIPWYPCNMFDSGARPNKKSRREEKKQLKKRKETIHNLHLGGKSECHWQSRWTLFFPKQFTVGVLNATLDLAALVLVGVVGFLGSEVVLSPVVSHCLRLSPFMWGVGVGWCGRLLGLWSGLVSRCLRLPPFMWGVGVGWCGRI